jgi:hypothetical protein
MPSVSSNFSWDDPFREAVLSRSEAWMVDVAEMPGAKRAEQRRAITEDLKTSQMN